MVYDIENLFNARPQSDVSRNIAQQQTAQTSQAQVNPARVDGNIAQQNFQNFAQNIAGKDETAKPESTPPELASSKLTPPELAPSEPASSEIPVSTRAPSRQSFFSNPLDVEGAFARLGELLGSNSRQSLERNYQGRGSLLNVVA